MCEKVIREREHARLDVAALAGEQRAAATEAVDDLVGHYQRVASSADRSHLLPACYDAAIFGSLDVQSEAGGRHGMFAARMRELKRPLLSRNKIGLTLGKIAEANGIDRTVLVALLYPGPVRQQLIAFSLMT